MDSKIRVSLFLFSQLSLELFVNEDVTPETAVLFQPPSATAAATEVELLVNSSSSSFLPSNTCPELLMLRLGFAFVFNSQQLPKF